MADINQVIAPEAADDLSAFIDSKPFWVIWQARLPAEGANRIRRISQDYETAARAEHDAEHYRKSGTITWVEEARPLAPRNVPAEAAAALLGAVPATEVAAIAGRAG